MRLDVQLAGVHKRLKMEEKLVSSVAVKFRPRVCGAVRWGASCCVAVSRLTLVSASVCFLEVATPRGANTGTV